MIDIVERLLAYWNTDAWVICKEAAEEIKRLRTEFELLTTEIERLKFIIEGLRTANTQLSIELKARGGGVTEIISPWS